MPQDMNVKDQLIALMRNTYQSVTGQPIHSLPDFLGTKMIDAKRQPTATVIYAVEGRGGVPVVSLCTGLGDFDGMFLVKDATDRTFRVLGSQDAGLLDDAASNLAATFTRLQRDRYLPA